MDFDLKEVIESFRAECNEGLQQMEANLLRMEGRPGEVALIDEVFRFVHTLKGNASALEMPSLTAFAHGLEDTLGKLRDGSAPLTTPLCSTLLKSVDILRAGVNNAVAGKDSLPECSEALLREIALNLDSDGEGTRTSESSSLENPSTPGNTQRTLRVKLEHLDGAMDLAAEITIAQSRLEQELQHNGGVAGAAFEVHQHLVTLFLDLQEYLLKMRMVSVHPLFRQFRRVVRDLCVVNGKKARLLVEGGEVEVDTSIAEYLKDALMHMVRNAIDHGLESPEERRAAGKDPYGTITLTARTEAGSILITVSDDGVGFNTEKILSHAESRGLVSSSHKMSESEITDLVFLPGFSTADKVTETSGRGVGMDVVRRNIDALHGSVRIESHRGKGSTFHIRLPLSLAIIDGFVFKIAEESFVVPMDSVVECLQLPADRMANNDGGILNFGREPLPFLSLRKFFGYADGSSSSGQQNVIVVNHGSGRAGLVVDELVGKGQTVIKPLGKVFQHASGIAGSTILGSGRVALILDIPSLVRTAVSRQQNLVVH